jgi:rod shape-determining protein MreB
MSNVKLAIDFDSVTTNIYMLGGGLVLSEPTVAAVSQDEKSEVKFIGEDARRLIGKTAKNTKIVFPIFEGEVVNERVAIGTLKAFLNKIGIKGGFSRCHALFSMPCGTTFEMIDAFTKVARGCGIKKVSFAEAPLLSALGQRIPLNDSTPCFVIDMGGGATNIAAVSLDGVIAGISVNFGGNKISTDIIDFIADKYGLQIGLLTAEKLKNEIGSLDDRDALSTIVNGRDLKTGAPRSISVRAMDIFEPVSAYFDKIAELSQAVLKKLPPEVSAEIRHAGIYIAGGASSIYALDRYYSQKFGMKINVAENGAMAIALGGGVALGDKALLEKIQLET